MEGTINRGALWISVQTCCVMEIREIGNVIQREALLSNVASGAWVGQIQKENFRPVAKTLNIT